MKLIVGLGNPGKEYELTRHNAGFLFLDYLLNKNMKGDYSWKNDSMFNCEIYKACNFTCIRPLSFMNNSGGVVKKYCEKNSIKLEDIIVAYDDLDIKLGIYKLAQSKSPKMHNGVNDIIRALGSENFYHARIGVDAREGGQCAIKGLDYVLMKMHKEELVVLNEVFEDLSKQINLLVE